MILFCLVSSIFLKFYLISSNLFCLELHKERERNESSPYTNWRSTYDPYDEEECGSTCSTCASRTRKEDEEIDEDLKKAGIGEDVLERMGKRWDEGIARGLIPI